MLDPYNMGKSHTEIKGLKIRKMRRDEAEFAIQMAAGEGWNPGIHELKLGRLAREIGFTQVSLSHQASPLIKLVSRGETTVVDAYLSPVLRRYVNMVQESLEEGREGKESRDEIEKENGDRTKKDSDDGSEREIGDETEKDSREYSWDGKENEAKRSPRLMYNGSSCKHTQKDFTPFIHFVQVYSPPGSFHFNFMTFFFSSTPFNSV